MTNPLGRELAVGLPLLEELGFELGVRSLLCHALETLGMIQIFGHELHACV